MKRKQVLITGENDVLGRVLAEKLGKEYVHRKDMSEEDVDQFLNGRGTEATVKGLDIETQPNIPVGEIRKISLHHKPLEYAPVVLGRNDPCSCGSGKKYKKCCLPAQAQMIAVQLRIQRKNSR